MIHDNPQEPLPKDDARRVVFDHFDDAKKGVRSRAAAWEDFYAAYRSHQKVDKTSPFRSKLFVPMTKSHIDSHRPRLAAARPRIEIWGRGDEDAGRARAHRALSFFFWDQLRMDMRGVDFITSALIYGTSFWRVGYRRSTRERLKRTMVQPEVSGINGMLINAGLMPAPPPQAQLVPHQVRIWDGPTVDLLEPTDVYPCPGFSGLDGIPYVILRSRISIEELEEAVGLDGQKLYKQEVVAKLRKKAEDEDNPIDLSGVEQRPPREGLFDRHPKELADPHRKEFHILEHWSDDKIVVVVEEFQDLEPVRNEVNQIGMIPVVRYTPDPLPNEFYGNSMVESLFSLQYSANILTNGRLDHLVQSVHAMNKIRRGSGIQPSQLRYRPGGNVLVTDTNDISPLETARLDFTHYREMEFLEKQAQDVSGSSEIYRGIGDNTGSTATESNILAQSAASRVGLMFQIYSSQSLNRLGRLWVRFNDLYMDAPRRLRILGDDFMEPVIGQDGQPAIGPDGQPQRRPVNDILVTPEQLASGSEDELDLVIDVASTEPGTRQFKLQRTMNAYQALGQRVPPGSPIDNKLMEGILEGTGDDNAKRTVDEQNRWLQAMQAAQQQAEQQAIQGQRSPGQELAVEASSAAGRGDQL